MPGTCQATRKDGQPCTAPVLRADASTCFAHDTSLQQARTEARRKGGQGKARMTRVQKLVPDDLRPTLALLFQALEQVHSGHLDPRPAGAMASLASAIGRLYQTAELEQRLAQLEARIAQSSGPGRWGT